MLRISTPGLYREGHLGVVVAMPLSVKVDRTWRLGARAAAGRGGPNIKTWLCVGLWACMDHGEKQQSISLCLVRELTDS